MIRYMATDGPDLYVVEEHGIRDWHIIEYPNGLQLLEQRFVEYFGPSLGKDIHIPKDTRGLSSPILQHLQERGVTPSVATEMDQVILLHHCVDDLVLDRYPELSWESFVQQRSGQSPGYATEESRVANARILEQICADPTVIGIQPDGWATYRETALSNMLSRCFDGTPEFLAYEQTLREPTQLASCGLVRLDLAFVRPECSYLIEIKSSNGTYDPMKPQRTEWSWRLARRQLRLAGHFVHHNFDSTSGICQKLPVRDRQHDVTSETYHAGFDTRRSTTDSLDTRPSTSIHSSQKSGMPLFRFVYVKYNYGTPEEHVRYAHYDFNLQTGNLVKLTRPSLASRV